MYDKSLIVAYIDANLNLYDIKNKKVAESFKQLGFQIVDNWEYTRKGYNN